MEKKKNLSNAIANTGRTSGAGIRSKMSPLGNNSTASKQATLSSGTSGASALKNYKTQMANVSSGVTTNAPKKSSPAAAILGAKTQANAKTSSKQAKMESMMNLLRNGKQNTTANSSAKKTAPSAKKTPRQAGSISSVGGTKRVLPLAAGSTITKRTLPQSTKSTVKKTLLNSKRTVLKRRSK